LGIIELADALFVLNKAIDSGAAQGLTVQEVHEHIESGDLVGYLETTLGLRFSGVREGIEENRLFIEALRHVMQPGGRERRVYGVKNNGACLLIAYITEIIQSGLWNLDSLPQYGHPG
jgi:hypothetical protein